jgi:hypothetical protein
MTEIAQYKMKYQVFADGYRSQTNDLEVAKIRADFYFANGNGKSYAEVTETNELGRFTVYRAKKV